MGAEHLTSRASRVSSAWVLGAAAIVAAAVGAVACRSAPPVDAGEGARVSLSRPAGARGAHMQIIRAMATKERAALVARFRERNGAEWTVTLGAGGAPDDVDAIRGILRRAKREGARAPTEAGPAGGARDESGSDGGTSEEERAIAEASAFVARNAEFLGFAPADVPALDVAAGPAKTAVYGSWVVHFRGNMPARGYEGFQAVQSVIDLLVYIGDDGSTRYFVNLSQVQPRLVLDTQPLLGPEDKRLLRFVVGRPVFVVLDDPMHPNARVRELTRVPLGLVADADVKAVRLTIHISPAPRGAYVSYWLAYAVDVVKNHQPFRFIVDADTGDLLEDAVVPVVPVSPLDD